MGGTTTLTGSLASYMLVSNDMTVVNQATIGPFGIAGNSDWLINQALLDGGIVATGSSTSLTNAGGITNGVDLQAGGMITNQAGGEIDSVFIQTYGPQF
jgi:hypothetical protein